VPRLRVDPRPRRTRTWNLFQAARFQVVRQGPWRASRSGHGSLVCLRRARRTISGDGEGARGPASSLPPVPRSWLDTGPLRAREAGRRLIAFVRPPSGASARRVPSSVPASVSEPTSSSCHRRLPGPKVAGHPAGRRSTGATTRHPGAAARPGKPSGGSARAWCARPPRAASAVLPAGPRHHTMCNRRGRGLVVAPRDREGPAHVRRHGVVAVGPPAPPPTPPIASGSPGRETWPAVARPGQVRPAIQARQPLANARPPSRT